MLRHAERIKARAIERVGALMRELPASKGGRPKTNGGAPISLSPRRQAAKAAGLSVDQTNQALRVNAYATAEPEAWPRGTVHSGTC